MVSSESEAPLRADAAWAYAWGGLICLALLLRAALVAGSPTPYGYVYDFYHEAVELFFSTGALPASTDCWQCYHPPLFYGLGLGFYSVGMAWGGSNEAALRVLSLLPQICGGVVVWMSYRLLRLYGASRAERLTGTAMALSIPCLFISSYASEADTLLGALLSVFVYALCRYHLAEREPPLRTALWIGALAGLAMATKYSGLVAPLLAGAVVAVQFTRPTRKRSLVVRNGCAILALALLVGGFKYVDNWIEYGTPLFANGTAQRGFSGGERRLHWDRYDFASIRPQALMSILPPDPPLGRLTDLDVYRSVFTTLYAQTWGDMSMFSEPSRHGTGVGLYPPRGVPRALSAAVLWLASGSVLLVALGVVVSARRLDCLPLLLLLLFSSGSYFYWVVAQPSWALKAKYLLFLLPAAIVYGIFGHRSLARRWPSGGAALVFWAWLLVAVTSAYLAAFALGSQAPRFEVPERVSAGGFAALRGPTSAFVFDPSDTPTRAFTYELMLRPAAALAESSGSNQVVFAERGAWGDNVIALNDEGTLAFVFHDELARRRGVLSRRPLEPEVWVHVAAVWTGEGVALYLNGEMQGYAPTQGVMRTQQRPLGRLGDSGGGGRAFQGDVAEVRAWNRALSQGELRRAMGRDASVLGEEDEAQRDWRFESSAPTPARSRGSDASALRPLS